MTDRSCSQLEQGAGLSNMLRAHQREALITLPLMHVNGPRADCLIKNMKADALLTIAPARLASCGKQQYKHKHNTLREGGVTFTFSLCEAAVT